MITTLNIVGLLVYIFVGLGIHSYVRKDDSSFERVWSIVIWPIIMFGFIMHCCWLGIFRFGELIGRKFKR